MPKKPYHHGNLRQALVTTALEILDEDSKLSLRTAAQRVGVSPNAAYRHFNNLDEMLGEVAAETLRELSHAIETSIEGDFSLEETQRRGMRAYLNYAITYPRRYGLVFSQRVPIFKHAAAHEASEYAFGIMAKQAQRAGAPNPAHTAFLILTVLHGTIEFLKRDVLPNALQNSRELLMEQAIDEGVRIIQRHQSL